MQIIQQTNSEIRDLTDTLSEAELDAVAGGMQAADINWISSNRPQDLPAVFTRALATSAAVHRERRNA
jgi:hypothetical protein